MSLEEKLLKVFSDMPDDKKIEDKQLESMMDIIIKENRDALEELAK